MSDYMGTTLVGIPHANGYVTVVEVHEGIAPQLVGMVQAGATFGQLVPLLSNIDYVQVD
jgi:hypothetical protein